MAGMDAQAGPRARNLRGPGRRLAPGTVPKGGSMLWSLAVFFLLLWITGYAGLYTLGAFVHLFLALALAAAVVQLLRGRRTP